MAEEVEHEGGLHPAPPPPTPRHPCARSFDAELAALAVRLPGPAGQQGVAAEEEFFLDPAVVRRNDTSAASIDEWTGQVGGRGWARRGRVCAWSGSQRLLACV